MEEKNVSIETAKEVGGIIGIDFTKFDLEQFRQGLGVEIEHGSHDPETDVIGDDLSLAGKIAWAHLKEIPDYYRRLEIMEGSAEK
jgi:hypothetical protein